MSRYEEYMKSMLRQEELRMAQANKQSDNVVDMVNNPPHYNQTGIECIHAISAATDKGFKYYLQGNVMKYLWRFDYKDKPLEDLQKAKWYLEKLIEEVMAGDES
jgi:predicted GTPase